jgi:hypothetical protein
MTTVPTLAGGEIGSDDLRTNQHLTLKQNLLRSSLV